MPSRSTSSRRPTATASFLDSSSEEAIGSRVKVRFSHAAARTSSGSGLSVSASIWAN